MMINPKINKLSTKQQILMVIGLAYITFSILAGIYNFYEKRTQIYCGTWQAQDVEHNNIVIRLAPKKMEVDGKIMNASQTGSGTSVNGEAIDMKTDQKERKYRKNKSDVSTYETILNSEGAVKYFIFTSSKNNKVYTIVFPRKDKDKAIMVESNSSNYALKGKVVYAMNKKTAPDYDEYMNKYIKKDIKD